MPIPFHSDFENLSENKIKNSKDIEHWTSKTSRLLHYNTFHNYNNSNSRGDFPETCCGFRKRSIHAGCGTSVLNNETARTHRFQLLARHLEFKVPDEATA